MARPTNPRFPHTCRIIRKTTDGPMAEEEEFSPMDEEVDDLLSEEVELEVGEEEEPECTTTVIYEGECRSYVISTTSDKGDIITSNRGLSLPLTQDDWTELDTIPLEGDEIVVDHGAFKEYGRIVDKNAATASFAGTHVIWKYGRN